LRRNGTNSNKFLWRNIDQSHRTHLIGWDVCYLQKSGGVLGLKIPPNMNDVFPREKALEPVQQEI